MIRKSLMLKLFSGFTMQRWNDQLRPVALIEMDKQAHALSLAYFLGRSLQDEEEIDFHEIIEESIFRYLERIIITDIKPQVISRIKANDKQYRDLRKYVKDQLMPYFDGLPMSFVDRFSYWCDNPDQNSDKLSMKILDIARADATIWEYELLEQTNPKAFGMKEIANDMILLKNKHIDLRRHLVRKLETKHIREENKHNLFDDEDYNSYEELVKMFAQMRYQVRWAQLHREPKTSVLGHSFFVTILSYFFSILAGSCPKRLYNNVFTALFHDLPEVFTRDIISPLKSNIPGLGDLIKEIEHEELNQKFKQLIPERLHEELFYFIDDEFADLIEKNGKIENLKEGIGKEYNHDDFNPKDGSLIRLADHLGAFFEAYTALANGATAMEFVSAKERIKNSYNDRAIAGLELKSLILDLE